MLGDRSSLGCAPRPQQQLPFAAMGVLLKSPLSGVLYKLLMGQDLDYLASSKDLSQEVNALLSLLTRYQPLLALLHQPVWHPADESVRSKQRYDEGSKPSSNTLVEAFQNVLTKCAILRQAQPYTDSPEDIAFLSAILDLETHVNNLLDAYQAWRKYLAIGQPVQRANSHPSSANNANPFAAASKQLVNQPEQQPQQPVGTSAMQKANSGGSMTWARNLLGTAGGGTKQRKGMEYRLDPELEARLWTWLKRNVQEAGGWLLEVDLLSAGFFFSSKLSGVDNAIADNKKRMRSIGQQVMMLVDMPQAWDSCVMVAKDSSRLDVFQFLIIPRRDTPYANAPFLFDMLLPGDFPANPPSVQFLTTGEGRVRFNPNLYDSGKVCLSLLGTWSGEKWIPGHSTLLQVILSIQSMIFVPDPYFNEPGYQRSQGTQDGDSRSNAYNDNIRVQTLRHALLPALTKPPPHFKEALELFYRAKADEVGLQCDEWVAATKCRSPIKEVVEQVKVALQKYKEQPVPPQELLPA